MCGAVKYKAEIEGGYSECHCKMCQRWASGRFMAVQTNSFDVLEGEDVLKVFKSSEWAERAFCSVCGSNLYYRMTDQGSPNVAIGTLNDTEGLTKKFSWFVDLKPDAYQADAGAKVFTQAETEAFFSGQGE